MNGLLNGHSGRGLKIEATHQGTVHGSGGEYAIDVLVTTEVFRGAQISILVECKHQQRPVERDELLILEGKLRDVGAHKGMLFSTSGFQSGALQYAHAHKIATISIREGRSLFETRGVGPSPDAPPWAQIDRVVGIRASLSETGGIMCHTIERGRVDALLEWFAPADEMGEP